MNSRNFSGAKWYVINIKEQIESDFKLKKVLRKLLFFSFSVLGLFRIVLLFLFYIFFNSMFFTGGQGKGCLICYIKIPLSLMERPIITKDDILKIKDGIEPVSTFFSKYSFSNLWRLPISRGISPAKANLNLIRNQNYSNDPYLTSFIKTKLKLSRKYM